MSWSRRVASSIQVLLLYCLHSLLTSCLFRPSRRFKMSEMQQDLLPVNSLLAVDSWSLGTEHYSQHNSNLTSTLELAKTLDHLLFLVHKTACLVVRIDHIEEFRVSIVTHLSKRCWRLYKCCEDVTFQFLGLRVRKPEDTPPSGALFKPGKFTVCYKTTGRVTSLIGSGIITIAFNDDTETFKRLVRQLRAQVPKSSTLTYFIVLFVWNTLTDSYRLQESIQCVRHVIHAKPTLKKEPILSREVASSGDDAQMWVYV